MNTATLNMYYRIEWPSDVRNELVKDKRFASKEEALACIQELWNGADPYLKPDVEPGHYYAAPIHFTKPEHGSPRIIPVVPSPSTCTRRMNKNILFSMLLLSCGACQEASQEGSRVSSRPAPNVPAPIPTGDFKPGAVVQLRSGGPLMTVKYTHQYWEEGLYCGVVWASKGDISQKEFPVVLLKVVEKSGSI